MPKTARSALLLVPVLLSLAVPLARAQTTVVAAGISHPTDQSGIVNGVRIEAQPDGSVWFLIPALDRIAVLRGDQMTQWQIREDRNRGANPIDFEIDGDVIWFLCNGESQIDAGHSILGRLDTSTGQVTEWEIPGSRPAGFYRAPDGKVWIPQTDRRIQSVDLTTLEVVDYRSTRTIAYSDVVLGPDGALWLTDFGSNRIVRYVPGAAEETSWFFFDPALAIFNPSQIQFDEQGALWISQLTGARMDRFDPATGLIKSYLGFVNPIHFDLSGGDVYVSEASGGNGQIAVLDPALAGSSDRELVAETVAVGSLVNARRAEVRSFTISPTTFSSPAETIPEADLEVASGIPGILRVEIPWTNAYAIEVTRGEIWVGTTGRLARVALQTAVGPADLSAPVATQLAGAAEQEGRVDVQLHNRSDQPMSGEILYLFSAAFFPARATFQLGPGGTVLLSDVFGDLGSATVPITGPVRIRVTSGPPGELVATVRSAKARPDGGSFGYSTPAFSAAEMVGAGSERTLFTGARETEVSTLGFSAPSGAEAVFTLVAPDGTVRGTLPISIAASVVQEFSPAASAFGVAAEPGDVVRVSVASGTLLPYVRVTDTGTGDVALSLPAAPTTDGAYPNAGTVVGLFGTAFVSDLFLSNPDQTREAAVTIFYRPLDPQAAAASRSLTLPPGTTRVIADVLPTLFGVEVGQGSLVVLSDIPIASSLRIASRKEEGDFATLALPIETDRVVRAGTSAFAVQTATRRTNLVLFNRGAAGLATVIALNGNADEIGRRTVFIGEDSSVRLDSVLVALGAEEERNGLLVVEPSEGMAVYAWSTEVDGPTGDVEIQPFR